jgi:lipid A 3-O-deacylase
MTTTMRARLYTAACLALLLPCVHAADWTPDAVTLQAGGGDSGALVVGAGLRWDWDFHRMRRKSELSAHTEVIVNEWRGERVDESGERFYTQVVVLPSLRMRLDRGASPWFLEVGIGASWMNRKFETPHKQLSTQWNFYDVLGLGYTLGGPQGTQEIDLRLVHVSNGGLRNPNPGLNTLQLRYSKEF